jgi:XTP/dITP diphosphohydrolase
MRLILASNNEHKLREFRGILPGREICRPADFGIDFQHEETGLGFAENALGKAMTLWRRVAAIPDLIASSLVLADDSGLVVPALGGEPGIYSARYGDITGGRPLDDRGRYELLLSRMQGIAEREAHFVCCLVLITGPDRFACFQETWEGSIATTPMSDGQGFGYDPIFWLPEYSCTVASLPAAEKNRISHRGQAMAHVRNYLDAHY